MPGESKIKPEPPPASQASDVDTFIPLWKNAEFEKPCEKHVCLIVRAAIGSMPDNIVEMVDWLERNIFPKDIFKKRRLLFYGYQHHFAALASPTSFEYFKDWRDLNNKLLFQEFSTATTKYEFDFCVFINIRRDLDYGLGIGLEDRQDERCLIRSAFLNSNGNLVFGDWGIPEGYPPGTTREMLPIKFKDWGLYMYMIRFATLHYNGTYSNGAIVRMVDHFLEPVSNEETHLSEDMFHQIRKGVEGTLFTETQLFYARWNAYWYLYFASDGMVVHCYHWGFGLQPLHASLIKNYYQFKAWLVSCTPLEKFQDVLAFLVNFPLLAFLLAMYLFVFDETLSVTKFIQWVLCTFLSWGAVLQIIYHPKTLYIPKDKIPALELAVLVTKKMTIYAFMEILRCLYVRTRLTPYYTLYDTLWILFFWLFIGCSEYIILYVPFKSLSPKMTPIPIVAFFMINFFVSDWNFIVKFALFVLEHTFIWIPLLYFLHLKYVAQVWLTYFIREFVLIWVELFTKKIPRMVLYYNPMTFKFYHDKQVRTTFAIIPIVTSLSILSLNMFWFC